MDIRLKWKNRSTGTSGTRIYRSENPIELNDLPEPIATIDLELEEYVDEGLIFGKEYYYRIATYNEHKTVYSSEIKATALPRSGPGPQLIESGDIEEGLYGILEASEFLDSNTLMSKLGVNFTTRHPLPQWFKFAYRGKTLFIPVQPIAWNLTWKTLYDNGLVYGVDGPGDLPEGGNITPRNQLRTVELNGETYIVRLMKGMADHNWNNQFTGVNEMIGQNGSEWNDLILRAVITGNLVTQRKPLFSNAVELTDYHKNDVYSILTHCQEARRSGAAIQGLYRGYHNGGTGVIYLGYGTFFDAITVGTSSYYPTWRPVLELVDDVPQ